LIGNHGKPTGRKCPKKCGGNVVYNGNYFCENWTSEPKLPGECDWALPHPQTERRDQEFALDIQGFWEEEIYLDGSDVYIVRHEKLPGGK
jgi:hypothetical protein